MKNTALLVGNSDGIGLETTKILLQQGWHVTGISRSNNSIADQVYHHIVADVKNHNFTAQLRDAVNTRGIPDVCIYCVGIGELINFSEFLKTRIQSGVKKPIAAATHEKRRSRNR